MDDSPTNFSPQPPAPGDQASSSDQVLAAMGGAVSALRRFQDHTTEILEAFDRAGKRRETGAAYRQIAEEESLFVDFSTGPFRELYEALSALRRTQAQALYDEGMTMAQLGRLLGVTRQRIAVLLGAQRARDTTLTDR
jgi:hypothetical protein